MGIRGEGYEVLMKDSGTRVQILEVVAYMSLERHISICSSLNPNSWFIVGQTGFFHQDLAVNLGEGKPEVCLKIPARDREVE